MRRLVDTQIKKTIGKNIYFIDKNGAFRISKVRAVNGNTISTVDAVGGRERIRPDLNKIFGIVKKTENNQAVIEPIEYGQIRTGKRLKTKRALKEIQAQRIKPLRTRRPRPGRPRAVK